MEKKNDAAKAEKLVARAAKLAAKAGAKGGNTNSPLSRARTALKTVMKDDHVVPLTDSTLRQALAHIPTGSIIVDYLIGGRPNQYGVAPCPGIPRGRIVNLYGNSGAGKTTLALTIAASVCEAGGTVAYIDWENEVEPRYAARLGVPVDDESRFVLMQPETLEDGLKIMIQMASEGVDLIVVDSVGAAVPEDLYHRDLEKEGDFGRIGLVAQKWSVFLPKFKTILSRSNTALLGISQLRKTMNSMGMGPDSAPQGGEAWKFYSAVRIMLRVFQKEKGKQFNAVTGKNEEMVVGTQVAIKLDKCKVSDSVHHEQKFYLRSGEGIDNLRSVMDLALAYKIVHQSGPTYVWGGSPEGELRCVGRDAFLRKIKEKGYLKALFDQVAPKLGTTTSGESAAEETEEAAVDDLFAEVLGPTQKTPPPSSSEGEE
jgi:recombination protein RecA